MKKRSKLGVIVYAVVSIVLIVAMIAANVITTNYKSIISTYLNQPTTEIIQGGKRGEFPVLHLGAVGKAAGQAGQKALRGDRFRGCGPAGKQHHGIR